MSLAIYGNISALRALGTRQAVTANNVANSSTREFKASRTLLEEGENGGVTARTQPVNTPGTLLNQPDGTLEETSNVDLTREMTEMIPTGHAYRANLQAVQTQAEMEETTLDLIG